MTQNINTLLQAPNATASGVKATSVKATTPAKTLNENAENPSSNDFKAFLKSQMQHKDNRANSTRPSEAMNANRASEQKLSQRDVKAQKLGAEKSVKNEAQVHAHANEKQAVRAGVAALDQALSEDDLISQTLPVALGVEAIEVDDNQLDTTQLTQLTSAVAPDEGAELNGFSQTPILNPMQVVSPQAEAIKLDVSQADLGQALDPSAGRNARANAPAMELPDQAAVTLNATTETLLRTESKGNSLSPGAFLQAMREVDMQTSQMEKAILQTTHPIQGMPAMEASVKGFAITPTAMSAIQTSFGQTGWHQEVQQKVVWMATGGLEAATLNLNPPELGPLKVVIQVHNQKADALFISDNADVRLALKDSMEQLREAMRGSAITLGETDVNASGQQHFQQHAEKQAQFNAISERATKGDVHLTTTEPQGQAKVRAHDGLVNTFA